MEDIVSGEKELLEEKSGKVSEDELIRIRKDKIVKFLKKDAYLSFLVILSGVSLILSIAGAMGLGTSLIGFEKHLWLGASIVLTLLVIDCLRKKKNANIY